MDFIERLLRDRHLDERRWTDLSEQLELINQRLEKMMATLDQVLQDVNDESAELDKLSVFIAGLKQQITDALSGATLPAGVQAKIDAVFAGAEANKAKINTALTP